eukprot:6207140-Pleurochrysis_carterae.AAC.1
MPEAINAKAEAGGASLLRVGQWVRERVTGCFLCINAIYKPLLVPRKSGTFALRAAGCMGR